MIARKTVTYFLFSNLLFISCKYTDSNNSKYAAHDNLLKRQWYRYYTGVKDGKPVMVNLQCDGKKIHGCYYYPDKGVITNLTEVEQNNGNNGNIILTENTREQKIQEDSDVVDRWQLKIQDSIADGLWISGDKRRSAGIDLKQAYPTGSYPLRELVTGNSKEERKEVLHITAATFYELVQAGAQMSKPDADYLNTSILHFLSGGNARAQNINDYVFREDKMYFENFERLLADMKIDHEAHEDWEYNFEHILRLNVLYNSDGLLVLQLASTERTGGGIMGSHFRNTYCCIDVQGKKIWQLNDIMEVDSKWLTPLLRAEAQKIAQQPNNLLAQKINTDNIPLTDNFYFTNTGVTFCYFAGVIAPEEIEEVRLFISFNQLKPRLKDDFKKRMASLGESYKN